jgi:pimeloyl-ACP methyl ester carboxylesterase
VINGKNKLILFIIILLLIVCKIDLFSKYIPQPVILIHGRGMHTGNTGNTWNTVTVNEGGMLLNFLQSYGIIYYYNDFSGQGYGALDNWGDELSNWVSDFKNEFENRPEHPEFTKFRLFSYSAGGLASRWYLVNNGVQKIERLITLNTPHQGAYLGSIGEIINYGGYVLVGLSGTYEMLALNPALSTICMPASIAAGITGGIVLFVRFAFADKLLPPIGITNRIDSDLYPISLFFSKLKTLESFPINQYKIKYKITSGRGAWINVGKFQSESFSAFMASIAYPSGWIPAIPLVLTLCSAILEKEGDFASLTNSQEGTDPYPFGPWYIHQSSDFDKTIVKTEKDHFNITNDGKLIIKLLEDASILSIENSNTLTAVKMEPDGCYVNIQKPEIHIDGSCDDYLIQWMGDNDRIRLRYDKYANVDEVIKLKNTEEGVFDYQRVGDVGRGWFSQKHTLQLGGENKIRIVAKNAADEESNHIARTYYSVGLRYPEDGEKGREMGEAVVWYEKDKLTGDIEYPLSDSRFL